MMKIFCALKMPRPVLVWTALLGLFSLALFPAPADAAAGAGYLRGVNIAGAEFAGNQIPGIMNKNYTFNDRATFEYFAGKGFKIFRVPILWERMQPALRGPLDAAYLNGLKSNIAWAKGCGTRVMIDVHNYCRYRKQVVGGGAVTAADLADLWVKLSNEFKNEPGVYAYDLMNEPHDMGTADWKAISQAVVTAIRNNGDTRLIAVEGNSFASAARWEKANGAPWITDPAGNIMYSAHCYFDGDASGIYKKSYDEELAKNPDLVNVGRKRVKVFADWCAAHHVRGHVGEYSVPKTDPRWLAVLDGFLDEMDKAGLDGTYWASGAWWGGDPMSVQPKDHFKTDAPQLAILLKHLSKQAIAPVAKKEASMQTKIRPFLMFQGRAEEAMKFYVSLFPDSEIKDVVRYGPGAAGKEGSVMKATFSLQGQAVMCIDSPAKHDFTFTPAFSFFVDCENEAEIKKLSTALGEGGAVLMPLDNYGFSRQFTWVNDRYGVSWQLNLE